MSISAILVAFACSLSVLADQPAFRPGELPFGADTLPPRALLLHPLLGDSSWGVSPGVQLDFGLLPAVLPDSWYAAGVSLGVEVAVLRRPNHRLSIHPALVTDYNLERPTGSLWLDYSGGGAGSRRFLAAGVHYGDAWQGDIRSLKHSLSVIEEISGASLRIFSDTPDWAVPVVAGWYLRPSPATAWELSLAADLTAVFYARGWRSDLASSSSLSSYSQRDVALLSAAWCRAWSGRLRTRLGLLLTLEELFSRLGSGVQDGYESVYLPLPLPVAELWWSL